MEHACPVVPIGKDPLLRPALPDDVDQSERRDAPSLFGGDVGVPEKGRRVEDVGVGWRHVHVATQRHIGSIGAHHGRQGVQPSELVAEVI